MPTPCGCAYRADAVSAERVSDAVTAHDIDTTS